MEREQGGRKFDKALCNNPEGEAHSQQLAGVVEGKKKWSRTGKRPQRQASDRGGVGGGKREEEGNYSGSPL